MADWGRLKAPILEDKDEVASKIWEWFGDNGAFIGGSPFCDGDDSGGLTDPERTPFDRLYYVCDDKAPFVALRLRPDAFAGGRLEDRMEIIARCDDKKKGLVIYFTNWDSVPELWTEVEEGEFLRGISAAAAPLLRLV